MSKENIVIENERGGKQSAIEGKMSEVPPMALIRVSKVMGMGSEVYPREEDGTPNWHKIGCLSNLDHAMEHMANFLVERNKARDRWDKEYMGEELSHAAARAMMALEQWLREDL